MTPLLKHSTLAFLLTLGACSPTAQTGGSMFFGDPGTEAAILAGSTAAGFDPTGVSSMAMAHVSRAAIEANVRKHQAAYDQQMRESHEAIMQLRENARRDKRAAQRGARSAGRTAPAETSE